MSVSLIAPNDPITCQDFWQIETNKGCRFGQTIGVAITTLEDPENPAATGQPTGYSLHLPQMADTNTLRLMDVTGECSL